MPLPLSAVDDQYGNVSLMHLRLLGLVAEDVRPSRQRNGPDAPVARRCQDTHSSPLGVVISKDNGHIETASAAERNQASGPDFQKAMIHTTIVGITEDEPDDKHN
jgi:hypothetical protein